MPLTDELPIVANEQLKDVPRDCLAFAVKIGTSWNNQISEKRVTDEIAQTLTEKGWKQVDANEASNWVRYQVGGISIRAAKAGSSSASRST